MFKYRQVTLGLWTIDLSKFCTWNERHFISKSLHPKNCPGFIILNVDVICSDCVILDSDVICSNKISLDFGVVRPYLKAFTFISLYNMYYWLFTDVSAAVCGHLHGATKFIDLHSTVRTRTVSNHTYALKTYVLVTI